MGTGEREEEVKYTQGREGYKGGVALWHRARIYPHETIRAGVNKK